MTGGTRRGGHNTAGAMGIVALALAVLPTGRSAAQVPAGAGTLIAFSGPNTLSFAPSTDWPSHNIYRGDLSVLRRTHECTQLPGSQPAADRACGIPGTDYFDTFVPAPGQVVFWLVTGESSGGAEEGFGDGRQASNVCTSDDPNHWIDTGYQHAAHYGDPGYYLFPAVMDIWTDFFLGRSTMATSPEYNDNTVEQRLQCPAGYCTGLTSAICIGAFANNCGGDGRCRPLSVGDTFFIGEIGDDVSLRPTAASRTHVITADNGPCAGGTAYTVYPWIDYATEPSTIGTPIAPAWRHDRHPTDGAAYLLGSLVGGASRDVYGVQGPNLIANPGFQSDGSGSVPGWVLTGGTITVASWDPGAGSSPPSNGASCNTGEGSAPAECIVLNGSGTDLTQIAPFAVDPGEQLIVSGLFEQHSGCDFIGLTDDRDGDGVFTQGNEMKVPFTDLDAKTNRFVFPRWFSSTVIVPAGVHAAKFLYHGCGSSDDWLDYVSVRRQTGLKNSAVSTNWLLNAPGARTISLVGDSWMTPLSYGLPYAEYFRWGLVDALNAHIGTCAGGTNTGAQCTYPGNADCPGNGTCQLTHPITTDQVTVNGHPGNVTGTILSYLPGILATDHPLYVIYDGGINDFVYGVPEADALENLKEIARQCMAAGAIPIYLDMAPVVRLDVTPRYGPGTLFDGARELRDGFRSWAMALEPPPGDGSRAERATRTHVESRNYCGAVRSAGTSVAWPVR